MTRRLYRTCRLRTHLAPTKDEDAMNVDPDHDSDYEKSSSDTGEESESDWERTTRKKGTQKRRNTRPPPTKRARLSIVSNKKQNVSKGRSKPKSFSMLFSMPMDILFEVFGRLSPQDLIALTRTSNVLRQTLLTCNSITLWKAARERVGAPECFRDFSEQRWAWLLFGGTSFKCHYCGEKRATKIDFVLRRRVCWQCKKNNLVSAFNFLSQFPDCDHVILDFIPYIIEKVRARGNARRSSKFYWASDIKDMAYQWGELQKAVHMRIPGAEQKMDDFRSERIDSVHKILKHADQCKGWFGRYAKTRRANRYHVIVEQFVILGYDKVDLEMVRFMEDKIEVDWQDLTDHIWKHIRPILEPVVEEAKARRLARERDAVIDSRILILKSLYKLYLKTLLPLQWAFQPCFAEVCKFLPFDTLMQAPNQVVVNSASFAEAITMLPGLISTWMQKRRRRLLAMLPVSSKVSTKAPSSLPTISRPSTITNARLLRGRNTTSRTPTSTIDHLSLARSVFTCGNSLCKGDISPWDRWGFSNALIAWDGIHTHQCQESVPYFPAEQRSVPSVYEFSHEGSAAAITLISLAGLEASSATPRDMDQCDLRFFCNTCGPTDHHPRYIYGRGVYTWRSAICHSIAEHEMPDWVVLTEKEKATIKPFEDIVDPIENDSCWTCNHCTIYLDCWESRRNVVDHLKTVHGIVDWEVPRDLFYIPYKRDSFIPVPVILMPKPGEAHCKHCPKSIRVFNSRGVRWHLKDKHNIIDPVEDVDWVETK